MAENNVEPEHEWSDRALDTAEDTLVAMETLLATLRAFEDVLRQQELSVESSTEYCDNFCQVLCTCSTKATPRLNASSPKTVYRATRKLVHLQSLLAAARCSTK